jgi:hypothetical protein
VGNKLNPNQFKLFYGAQELQDAITDSNDRNVLYDAAAGEMMRDDNGILQKESMPDMWSRKLQESKQREGYGHGSGVYDSMMSEGVRPHTSLKLYHADQPGVNNKRVIADGHHRVAAAADIERTTGKNMWIFTDHADNYTRHHLAEWGDKVQADRWRKQMAGYQSPADNATPSAHKQLTNDIVHMVL